MDKSEKAKSAENSKDLKRRNRKKELFNNLEELSSYFGYIGKITPADIPQFMSNLAVGEEEISENIETQYDAKMEEFNLRRPMATTEERDQARQEISTQIRNKYREILDYYERANKAINAYSEFIRSKGEKTKRRKGGKQKKKAGKKRKNVKYI